MNKNPLLYEINTWAWLAGLSRKYGRAITLRDVPASEWDAIAAYGFDYVWLMGVWERSPAGKGIGLQNPGLRDEFRAVLPDFNDDDLPGSPFCIRGYQCDPRLGGATGLAEARGELARRGMRLILDFVPNHVAPDHPWSVEHPEYFVQGSREDLFDHPDAYLEISGNVIARGRDPNSSPWPDVIQLNLFSQGLRQALAQTLLDICAQCDGLRVDMAMLAINRIFQATWGERAGDVPAEEFWPPVIRQVKAQFPETLLIAEAYWDTERELHGLGFDCCYDKLLYDDLRDGNLDHLRWLLSQDAGYQEKLVRFTENHDEQRAAVVFPDKKLFPANLATYTLPGAHLFHEGQLEGYKTRLPVLLGRRPNEETDEAVRGFYWQLLELLRHPAFHAGSWLLCRVDPGDSPIIAWTWRHADAGWLVAVNLSGEQLEAVIFVEMNEKLSRNSIVKIRMSNIAEPQEWTEKDIENGQITIQLDGWGYLAIEVSGL